MVLIYLCHFTLRLPSTYTSTVIIFSLIGVQPTACIHIRVYCIYKSDCTCIFEYYMRGVAFCIVRTPLKSHSNLATEWMALPARYRHSYPKGKAIRFLPNRNGTAHWWEGARAGTEKTIGGKKAEISAAVRETERLSRGPGSRHAALFDFSWLKFKNILKPNVP